MGGYDHAMRDQIAHQATELLHSSWPRSSSSFVPRTGSLPRTNSTLNCAHVAVFALLCHSVPDQTAASALLLLYYKDTVARAAGHRTM